MAKVYAPVKNYTGISAGVSFLNGVGETNSPHLIEWFRKHDYLIEGDEDVASAAGMFEYTQVTNANVAVTGNATTEQFTEDIEPDLDEDIESEEQPKKTRKAKA